MGKRVLMFPMPYQGHINPMLEVAAVLHARGLAIAIFHMTTFNPIDPAKYPSYRFVPVDDRGVSGRFGPMIGDVVRRFVAWNDCCEELFWDGLMDALSDGDEEPVACLIRDMHWYNLERIANRLRIRSLVLRTGSAASLNWLVTCPLLVDQGLIPVKDQADLDMPVDELAPLRVRDLPSVGDCGDEMLYKLLMHDVEALRVSAGVIVNTFDAIESSEVEKFREAIPVPVFCIGPLHKFTPPAKSSLLNQDHTCLEWLDKQALDSVLYVSFGSIASMTYNEFVETAWGLANSGQPFIWVVRPGSIIGEDDNIDFPDGFVDATSGRSRIITWAPQQDVLAHPATGAFWTHNGWNSTLEALCEGVPMICRPQFGDQMGNARYVTHVWNVGVGLEGELERGNIEKAIERVMRGNEGAEIRERMRRMKHEASCCIKSDGSSSVSIDKLIDFISVS